MILFYLIDNEILQSAEVIENLGYKKLLEKLEIELKLLLTFAPENEYIIFSPSFLCESNIAYDLSQRCQPLVDARLIRVYMREDNFNELREKKIDNSSYGRLFGTVPGLKKSYSIENISRIKKLNFPIERKIIKVGKNSYSEFVPRLLYNSQKEGYDVTELLKRLTDSESESFLWQSVKNQSSKLLIPNKILMKLEIRALMNASYLDTFRSHDIKIPINSSIIPNPKFKTENFYCNTIDLDLLRKCAYYLDIYNDIIQITYRNFIKLKYNVDFMLLISQVRSIINKSKCIEEAFFLIKCESIDIQLKQIFFDILGKKKESRKKMKEKIFIVHGHDTQAKEIMARTLEKGGFEVIILHEQASGGKSIIEKIEEYSDVSFAVVLYTGCDIGKSKDSKKKCKLRARQNVVFEHGYLIGKLGRERVCALVKDDVEIPGDMKGVIYIEMDDRKAWKMELAKEMKNVGINIIQDFYS